MKIALMHNLYGQFSRGGAETVVAMLAEDYRRQGHEVFLITTKPRQTITPAPIPLKIYYLNSNFYKLAKIPGALRFFWHIGNIFSLKKYGQIKKILATEKPDTVMTHNLLGLGFLTPLAIRRLKIRHEHFLHDIQLIHPSGLMIWGKEKKINSPGAKIYQALTRVLFASPAQVISPSRWLWELHNQHNFFKNSEKEIRPFVWPKMAVTRPTQKAGAKNFLFVGQIETSKGIFLLINAWKKISDPDIKLRIVIRGGGQKLNEAKKAASGDRRLEFLGPLSYEEAHKIMAISDCLIVPSLCYENSPTVIYGAHAQGLKVLAAAIGGIPEIIGPDDKLFQAGDENDLREKIKNYLLP